MTGQLRRLAPVPPLHTVSARSGHVLWIACCAGREPAESLHWRDREDLFFGLEDAGWFPAAIAMHTRTSETVVHRVLRRRWTSDDLLAGFRRAS